MIAVDANLFLRWLVEDDKSKADAFARLIKKTQKAGEFLWVSDLTIAELVWVLESYYRIPIQEITGHIESLLDMPVFVFENRDRLLRSMELYRAHQVDFIDCYIAAAALDRGLDAVASYDQDFDRLPIKRIQP